MKKFHFGLLILTFFSFVACVQVKAISSSRQSVTPSEVTSSGEFSESLTSQSVTPSEVTLSDEFTYPVCLLNPPITTVHKQENSSWCWAASTNLVINHLEPARQREQCKAVDITLSPERKDYETNNPNVNVDCCLVTDEEMKKFAPNGTPQLPSRDVIGSVSVCHTTGRPERALSALGYENRFEIVRWNPETDPYTDPPHGLTFSELTIQICNNRPFISVKLWDEGGTHTEVVTGYGLGPDPWVVVDTHGMDGLFTEPYDDYLGIPGDYIHVRDYYDIGL